MGDSLDLIQFHPCPIRQMLIVKDSDKVAPVKMGLFSVIEELTEHFPAGGFGRAAETAVRIEELVLRFLVGVFQPVGTDDQHLSGVVGRLLGIQTVGLVIQPKLPPCLPGQIDEAIQHGRMAFYGECPVGVILGDIDAPAPILIGGREASIVGLLPDGIGEDEVYPVETKLGDDFSGTATLQGAAIEAAGDGILDGSGTLTVFLMTFPP